MAECILYGNGGGSAGLNFKVVGGTIAPTNPKENTIWVNTDAEIKYVVFSPTFAGAAEGMVWIKDTATALEEPLFNALDSNKTYIYCMPMSVRQYVNGAWVDKTAKIYQNGTWIDLLTYLYNRGDERTSLTGGWEISYYNDIGQIVVTRDGGRFYLSSLGDVNGGCNFYVSTNKKVNLTNFSKLYARIVHTSTYATHFYFSASTVNTQTSSAARAIVENSGEYLVEVDVSNLSGEYYVMFGLVGAAQNNSGNCYVDEVYLK